jgi:hypothetical protein
VNELLRLVPPPATAPPVPGWAEPLPADYRELLAHYGLGNLAGLRLIVPEEEAERQRWALAQYEDPLPYAPADLLPWGIDESGNVVWWLTSEPAWVVVANEARGEEWFRHEGGAVSFLEAILSGREQSDFLVIEGDDFEPREA